MSKGYFKDEIIENGWDIEDFKQCQDYLKWFDICDLCKRDSEEDDENEDNRLYCDNCR